MCEFRWQTCATPSRYWVYSEQGNVMACGRHLTGAVLSVYELPHVRSVRVTVRCDKRHPTTAQIWGPHSHTDLSAHL